MNYDASPSWSGFNYQGKVALYYAIKLINTEPDTDYSNFSLMLEATEDFEIQCGGDPVSFHQVKAYNKSSYGKYSEALLAITFELYKQPIVLGKIHTWNPINPKPKFNGLIDSIKDDLRKILADYHNADPKIGKTILEKAASSDKGIPKEAAILRTAFKDKTLEELRDILNSILTLESDALSRLESYQYDDGKKSCGLNEINRKIELEISKALNLREVTVTPEQLKKTFHYFLGMMDNHIIQRHKTKQDEEKIVISFNEIVEALEFDHEDIGDDYLFFKFKGKFAHLIDEYMSDPEDYSGPKEGEPCNLREARNTLLCLSPYDLWEHCRSFSPDSYFEHGNNTDNALETNPNGIRYVLIKTLHAINFQRFSHTPLKYSFSYRTNTVPYRNYIPTTITSDAKATQIAMKISLNPSLIEILFEVENLIYSGATTHSFSPSMLKSTEAPPSVDEGNDSKRDEALRDITLVPLSEAKEALA